MSKKTKKKGVNWGKVLLVGGGSIVGLVALNELFKPRDEGSYVPGYSDILPPFLEESLSGLLPPMLRGGGQPETTTPPPEDAQPRETVEETVIAPPAPPPARPGQPDATPQPPWWETLGGIGVVSAGVIGGGWSLAKVIQAIKGGGYRPTMPKMTGFGPMGLGTMALLPPGLLSRGTYEYSPLSAEYWLSMFAPRAVQLQPSMPSVPETRRVSYAAAARAVGYNPAMIAQLKAGAIARQAAQNRMIAQRQVWYAGSTTTAAQRAASGAYDIFAMG